MTLQEEMGEPFGFWLVREFMISPNDQADEVQPLTNRYTLLTGIVILLVIEMVRLLIPR
jgi:hypothetical protein